jgi:hypothetical protein
MRKDYIPATDATAAASDETTFVARYWADVWKSHDAAADVSALARRDEYRVIPVPGQARAGQPRAGRRLRPR